MKNSVLRKKLGIRFVSIATAMMLAAGSLAGCGATSNNTDISTEIESVTQDEDSNALQAIMEQQAGLSHSTSGNPSKEEVVYVLADANGNTNKVIVSDWLKNTKGDKSITDTSVLTDISNVSGDETFSQDADGNIIWNANGNDIHYQGTSTAELPISVKITYKLDGKEITPEELAGKSGKVSIRFDYTNNETKTVEIGGEEKEIYVPFTMMSGAILSSGHFNNIEVTNGRVISTGGDNIVVGMAFPGLADSLNMDELKDKLDEKVDNDKFEEAKIPDYVEITADAVDFQMDQTMTMALSDVLSSLNLDDEFSIDTSNITDSMDELSDASTQLANGSSQLYDGAGKLTDGAKTLSEKSVELDDGAKKLYDGATQLNNGAISLKDGANQLNEGASKLSDGIGQVDNGVASLKEGAGKLDAGAGNLKDGADKLAAGTKKLAESAPDLDNGAGQLKNGYAQLSPAIDQIAQGSTTWFSSAQDAYNTIFAKQVEKGYTWSAVYNSYKNSQAAYLSLGGVSNEAAEEIEDLSSSMSSDLEGYYEMLSIYESEMNEMANAVDIDKANINELLNNPSVEEVEVITGQENVEETYNYNYVTEINKYITNVTNTTVTYSGEEGSEPVTSSETESSEENEEVSGEGNGTYTYTNYTTENRSYVNYDIDTINAALDKYAEDYQAYAEAYAGYIAYSNLISEMGEQVAAVEALGVTITNQGSNTDQAMLELACVCAALYGIADKADVMAAGNAQLTQGLMQLKAGTESAVAGANQLNDGANQLAAGAGSLKDGTSQLANGAGNLKEGTSQLVDGASTLKDGTTQLSNGAVSLQEGTSTLQEGTSTLQDGTSQFVDGTKELYNGTLTLDDGTRELMNGMFKFKDEGIDKLTEMFGSNVGNVIDTLKAVMDAGSAYNSFSGANSDVESSVKFIYKTDSVK